jgi:hypothetical protein
MIVGRAMEEYPVRPRQAAYLGFVVPPPLFFVLLAVMVLAHIFSVKGQSIFSTANLPEARQTVYDDLNDRVSINSCS